MFAKHRVSWFILPCLLIAVWVLPSTRLAAQQTSNSESTTPVRFIEDAKQLVLGDFCLITAERGKTSEQYSGVLLLSNDNWLVLRRISQCRCDYATPVLSDIPYINRWFRHVAIGRENDYIWIPRPAIALCERTTTMPRTEISDSNLKGVFAPPTGDSPTIGDQCSLDIAETNQVATHEGKLAGMIDGKVSIASETAEPQQRPIAGWSRIPLVGPVFKTQVFVAKTTQESFSLDDVLSVRVPADSWPE